MKILKSKKGYMSLSIKIIISIVIGGLLIIGMNNLVREKIVPKMVEKSEKTLVVNQEESSNLEEYIVV